MRRRQHECQNFSSKESPSARNKSNALHNKQNMQARTILTLMVRLMVLYLKVQGKVQLQL